MTEPERTCVACRARAPKSTLVRFAWDASGATLLVDLRQRAPGRGGYLHRRCVDRTAGITRALGRALRRSLDRAMVERVLSELAAQAPVG